MARPLSLVQAQLNEQISAAYPPTASGTASSTVTTDNTKEFSLKCLLKATQVSNTTALISRIFYDFPTRMAVSSGEALRYADNINRLLQYSQVFVMQDIDGDRRYALRMDTLLAEPEQRENVAQFLDNITLDVGVLMQYFHNHAAPRPIDSQQAAHR